MKHRKTVRILLADDHAVLREGLKTLVHSQRGMKVVGEAADAQTVVTLAERLRPDVVVMDVSMPGGSGSTATRRLKEANPEVRVIALTVHEDRSYLQEMLEAGASGYVLKRAAASELVHAIRVVAEGGDYLDPNMSSALIRTLHVNTRSPKSAPQEMSERETAVAKLIAHGYTQKEIAARLNLSIKTIETHKARCMEKLRLGSRAELVRYACEHGWLSVR